MPVVVSCRCGQRFAANDQLIGQEVPCPACGGMLPITVNTRASQGVVVSCGCGRSFSAPAKLCGQVTSCPACGGNLRVPAAPDSLSGAVAGMRELARVQREQQIPWRTIRWMAGIGTIALAVLVAVMSIVNVMRAPTEMDAAPPPLAFQYGPPQTPSVVANARAVPPPAPPKPPVEVVDLTEDPFVAVTSESSVAVASEKLTQGMQDWHGQTDTKLAGIRRANATDPPLAHFSWLTGLLPFLGHKQTYERFDFQKTLEADHNLQVGATIVPEFLNPLDDRKRWRGYPFDGIALTHYVGISGVEDTRNTVAAKLPRTDPRAGIFGYDEVARPEEITDGKSQTMMIAGAGELANPWAFGGGATIRGARDPIFDKTSGFGTKGIPGGGTIVVMADGSVRHVHGNVDPSVFKAMSTIHGAESVDIERDAKPFDMQRLQESKK